MKAKKIVKRRNSFESKIKAYSSLAAGVIVTGSVANAQIVYTDIIPDHVQNSIGSYDIDLNSDAIIDFRLFVSSATNSNMVRMIALNSNEVLGSSSSYFYPFAINQNAPISASQSVWSSWSGSNMSLNFVINSNGYGNWQGVSDKYLGLRIKISGNWHYGWARLDVNSLGTSFTIKDYAYVSTSGLSLSAGQKYYVAEPATNVVASDIADNYNGSDLLVMFDNAMVETFINKYKILVVKNAKVATFNIDSALAVTSGNYTEVTPTGNNIAKVLDSLARDTDGDIITNGVPYSVFVFSDATSNNISTLSSPSNQIILATNIFPSDTAFNVIINDIADNSDGTDMRVSFSKATDESKVGEYRIIVVKSLDASTFTVDTANAVIPGNYIGITPTGNNVVDTLGSLSNDRDGQKIGVGIEYKVFILSVADGVKANVNVLSSSSNALILNTVSDTAYNVLISDIGDSSDAQDFQVSFNRASLETKIAEYRVIAVRSVDADSFNVDSANLVSTGNYSAVVPNGSNQVITLFSNPRDKDGITIGIGISYKAFVLSIADSSIANVNVLSSASNELTLTTPTDTASNLQIQDIADNSNATDLEVSFNNASDESKIYEYRIIIIKSADTASFNIDSANSVISANYTPFVPTGKNVLFVLSSGARDKDGDTIAIDISYTAFVLSIADSTNANVNQLSLPSNDLILNTSSEAASKVQISDIGDNSDGSDFGFLISKAKDETKVAEYRLIVLKSADADSFNIDSANIVQAPNYAVLTPQGTNIIDTLTSSSTDKDGDPIEIGVAYKAFVLSIADGYNANINVLSTSSAELILNTPAGSVSNLTITDIGRNSNGSDLEVIFDKASDESRVSEYRIIIVKSADAITFNLATANAVVAANYLVIAPSGNNIVDTLSNSANDKDGDPIRIGVAYKAFVLSIADQVIANVNLLSSASNELILNTTTDTISNLVISDVSNNSDGTDFEVSFYNAVDESTITEYRSIIVKSADAASFDLASAITVIPANYTAITPTGSNIIQKLDAMARDKDGDPIVIGSAYKAFVLNIADGNNANINVLSEMSNELILYTPSDTVSNLLLADVSNNSDGSDLRVSFDKATKESLISEYRIIIVKSADAATFNVNLANAVIVANYTAVTPTGNNFINILSSTATDKDGDLIIKGVPYKAFILSVADGIIANVNVLSSQSKEVTLVTPADKASNVRAFDIGDKNNGSDVEVSFDKAIKESTVTEYRIIVVKSSDASTFEVIKANAVSAGNYTSVAPSGGNITKTFSANAKDKDGDLITINVKYKVFVLSVADGTFADFNALSAPSYEFQLINASGISDNDKPWDYINIYSNGSDVHIKMLAVLKQNGIVTICNSAGKEMYRSKLRNKDQKITLNNMSAGVYLVNIIFKNEIISKKLFLSK